MPRRSKDAVEPDRRPRRLETSRPKTAHAAKSGQVPSRGPRGGREEVEERVVAAAQELFAERGFRAVSVRDIAAKAGVSHALVHRYLGSKREILLAVLRRNATPVVSTIRGKEAMSDAALAAMRQLRSSQRDYMKLIARLAMDHVAFRTLGHDFPAFQQFIGLAQGAAAGGPATDEALPDPRVLLAAVVVLMFGWTAFEEFALEATGLSKSDRARVEASLERVVVNMIDANLPSARRGARAGAADDPPGTADDPPGTTRAGS